MVELKRRGLSSENAPDSSFVQYRFDPSRYIREKLGWQPWSGTQDDPGQQQVIDAYTLALRQLDERQAFESGEIAEDSLTYWHPGDIIKNIIRVEAGHTVGKTKLGSGLVNHFFDCFPPAIVYTFAPTADVNRLNLWKEISTDRANKGLPGRVLETCEIKYKTNHFAIGRATNNTHGSGTERIQGQHGEHLMFVVDEAEGVADFVRDAILSMMSGGQCVAILYANPRTRSSWFHKLKNLSNVQSFRISSISHPNVTADREIVPGAVRRQYIASMVESHCDIVDKHEPDEFTFTLDFAICIANTATGEMVNCSAGTIFKPDAEFMWRVLGVAPVNISDKTLIPVGRYEAAWKRQAPLIATQPEKVWLGVDVAGFGNDMGTVYARHSATVWRAAQISKLDQFEYFERIKTIALQIKANNPEAVELRIRIDAGGGFGGGIIALLKRCDELKKAFPVVFEVHEVHFGGTPKDASAYDNLATNMLAECAETLKGICLRNPPETLEADLCERQYEWVNKSGVSVKRIEAKKEFRKPTRLGRSPDDGDGFMLCVSPDGLFGVVDWAIT